jgi:predicted nucleotidyltransferase
MISLIEEQKDAVAELCRRFRVQRLFLFGSATSERFCEASSDLDFLVEMEDRQPTGAYADRYLGLAEALEKLFGRRVDLVTAQAIRNPFLRRQVEESRELLYEHGGEKASR